MNSSQRQVNAKRAVSPAKIPHEIRIVGGQFKRRKLKVADKPGLRPTPDRVRETLFNWLGQDLCGWHCMDAFAGTGALGLEAVSRGAAQVMLVELDVSLAQQLQEVVRLWRVETAQVRRGEAVQVLNSVPAASLEMVFLDPPFSEPNLFKPALEGAARAVQANGWVYLEAPQVWSEAALLPLGLMPWRYLKAGAVHAHLLKKVHLNHCADNPVPPLKQYL